MKRPAPRRGRILVSLLFLLFCLTYMRRETLIPANVRRSDLPCKAFDAKRRRLIRPACVDAAACVVPHDQAQRVEGESSQHERSPAAPAPY